MFYAELDENNKVHTVCDLYSDDMATDKIIQIDTFDLSLIGKTYDPETGMFN